MPETREFRLVDAFAEQPYRGNPAGVVLDADGLSDTQMQRIAREINASETSFLTRLNDLHRLPRLRWFTPATEVQFCGHATLAAAHALADSGALTQILARPEPCVTFESAAGELRLYPERLPPPHNQFVWWLQMPDPRLEPDHTNPLRTCDLLGITLDDLAPALPPARTRDNDVIFMITSWQRLMELSPNFAALAEWCQQSNIRGVCVATTATLSESTSVHSRFFAPAVGINEDPVTGSVHGPLAALLVRHGAVPSVAGLAGLMCLQGRGERIGVVRARVQTTATGCSVRIGGVCHTTVSGTVRVPPEAPA